MYCTSSTYKYWSSKNWCDLLYLPTTTGKATATCDDLLCLADAVCGGNVDMTEVIEKEKGGDLINIDENK